MRFHILPISYGRWIATKISHKTSLYCISFILNNWHSENILWKSRIFLENHIFKSFSKLSKKVAELDYDHIFTRYYIPWHAAVDDYFERIEEANEKIDTVDHILDNLIVKDAEKNGILIYRETLSGFILSTNHVDRSNDHKWNLRQEEQWYYSHKH